jgi:hypothetical protein
MKKIEKITIVKTIDTNPIFSDLGEYTNNLEDGVIVRKYNDYFENLTDEQKENVSIHHEYSGFKPYAGGEEVGTKEYYEYGMQDYKRMVAYNRNEWCYIGVYAKATVETSQNGKEWLINGITSGGVWGIESDSADEIKQVIDDEKEVLKQTLLEFGFTESEINDAFSKPIEEVTE